jgi:hypothetical protein
LAATWLARWNTGFIRVKALIGDQMALVPPHPNVSEKNQSRLAALNLNEPGIILHPLAAVADNPPMVHDDAGGNLGVRQQFLTASSRLMIDLGRRFNL